MKHFSFATTFTDAVENFSDFNLFDDHKISEIEFIITLNISLKKRGMIKFSSKHNIYGWKGCSAPDVGIRENVNVCNETREGCLRLWKSRLPFKTHLMSSLPSKDVKVIFACFVSLQDLF